jgi:hypothetical protein
LKVKGQVFLDIVSKDLTAIGKHAYDFSDHSFNPLLNDGAKLWLLTSAYFLWSLSQEACSTILDINILPNREKTLNLL